METLKKLFINFKKHSKIYIAFAMIITCVFGVMFATSSFAYNTTDNYNITNTIENITNTNFNSMQYKTFLNGNKTKQYIELQRTSNNNVLSFNVKNDYLTDTNYNNYTLFINYDYGWYSSGQWRSYNNGANVYINLSLYINANQINSTNQYLYNNMLTDTTFNYSYRTNAISNNRYTDTISSSTTFNLLISQQASSNYYLRIYNIDFVNNNDITFSYYYDNIYQQYNELLEDYEDLETDYSQLNNDYSQLESDYNDLDEQYNYLDGLYTDLQNNGINNIYGGLYASLNGTTARLYNSQNPSLSVLDNQTPLLSETISFSSFAYTTPHDIAQYILNDNYQDLVDRCLVRLDLSKPTLFKTLSFSRIDNNQNRFIYLYFDDDTSETLTINDSGDYDFKSITWVNTYNKYLTNIVYDNEPSYDVISYISSDSDGQSYQNGYDKGYAIGYNEHQGVLEDTLNELRNKYQNAFDNGYNTGFLDADTSGFASSGFANLINAILSYPVNFIKEVFNFEFMGINISALITFILSIGIVAFIIQYFRKH